MSRCLRGKKFKDLPDGYVLDQGFVVSRAVKNGVCAVMKCACGREQMALYPPHSDGLDADEAQLLGWTCEGDKWTCPFCRLFLAARRISDEQKSRLLTP